MPSDRERKEFRDRAAIVTHAGFALPNGAVISRCGPGRWRTRVFFKNPTCRHCQKSLMLAERERREGSDE